MTGQTDSTAREDQPVTAPSGPRLPGMAIDVVFEAKLFPSERHVLGMVFAAVLSIVGVVVLRECFPALPRWLSFAPLFVVFLAYFPLEQARARRVARNWMLANRDQPLAEPIAAVVERLRGSGVFAGIQELTRSLLLGSGGGCTIRLVGSPETPGVEPLTFPFEPLPLDESHSVFVRNADRIELGTYSASAETSVSSAELRSDSVRWLGRKMALGGGRLMFILVGLNAALQFLDVCLERRVNLQFVFSQLCLLGFLVPTGARLRTSSQWWAAPGSLILRRAGWGQGGWKVKPFYRDQSVLLVARVNRRQWAAFVADSQQAEWLVATEREAAFLLRAWLSPLPPPPVERLSDLS